jgi:hypothetical protein
LKTSGSLKLSTDGVPNRREGFLDDNYKVIEGPDAKYDYHYI